MPSWVIGGLSLLPAYAVRHPVCIRSSCTVELTTIIPHCVGSKSRSCTAWRFLHLRPTGPRSGQGYSVPVHHHLIDPIRPTRRHIAISPRSGLYAMSSLCGSAEATHEWFRAFAAHSFLTCRPLRPRGARTSHCPMSRCRHGLRRRLTGSTLPSIPQSDSRGAQFRGFTGSQLLRPVRLLASLVGSDRDSSQPPEAFTSRLSTDRSPFPPLDMTTTSTGLLCRRDLHPLEWQLASLH